MNIVVEELNSSKQYLEKLVRDLETKSKEMDEIKKERNAYWRAFFIWAAIFILSCAVATSIEDVVLLACYSMLVTIYYFAEAWEKQGDINRCGYWRVENQIPEIKLRIEIYRELLNKSAISEDGEDLAPF